MTGKSKARAKARKRPAGGHPPAQNRAAPNRPRTSAQSTAPIANRVAVATAPGLVVLGRLPKLLLPVLVAIGVIAGLALGGIAGLTCLLAVVALLGWLLAAFWPMIPPAGRVVRVAALVAVLVVGILRT